MARIAQNAVRLQAQQDSASVCEPLRGRPFAGESGDGKNVFSPSIRLVAAAKPPKLDGDIAQSPLFQGMPLETRRQMIQSAEKLRLRRLQTLFSEGEEVRGVALLKAGRLKITKLSSIGDEVLLYLLGLGEALSQTSGTGRDENVHAQTARAIEPSEVLFWNTQVFAAYCKQFPVLQQNQARILAQRLLGLEQRFHELATEKVEVRLASTLLRLAGPQASGPQQGIRVELSHKEIAEMTATTPFTVSRLLCQWRKSGIVDSRRGVVYLRDVTSLASISRALDLSHRAKISCSVS